MHHVIFVPGLGDRKQPLSTILRSLWQNRGLQTEVFLFGWNDEEGTFSDKQELLLGKVDHLISEEHAVSLVGISAGGSAVLNAFVERPHQIHRVVNVCGRLQRGENVKPTLEKASERHPLFAASVRQCEERLSHISPDQASQILTMRPIFDEVVPMSTVPIIGARNVRIFSFFHMPSISLALTCFRGEIIDFLTGEPN